jgi:hypothetical protein
MYAVQNTFGKLCQGQSARQTEHDGDRRQEKVLTNDKPLNRADLRAECQADANLTGAPADGVAALMPKV